MPITTVVMQGVGPNVPFEQMLVDKGVEATAAFQIDEVQAHLESLNAYKIESTQLTAVDLLVGNEIMGRLEQFVTANFTQKRFGPRVEIVQYRRYHRTLAPGEPQPRQYNIDYSSEFRLLDQSASFTFKITTRWSNQKVEREFTTIKELKEYLSYIYLSTPALMTYIETYDHLRGKQTS